MYLYTFHRTLLLEIRCREASCLLLSLLLLFVYILPYSPYLLPHFAFVLTIYTCICIIIAVVHKIWLPIIFSYPEGQGLSLCNIYKHYSCITYTLSRRKNVKCSESVRRSKRILCCGQIPRLVRILSISVRMLYPLTMAVPLVGE